MSFHDRSNCHCPTCMNYRRMIDALQVSDLRMATSNPVPVPDSFASLAMQIVDPVPSRLSSAIHSSMPVPKLAPSSASEARTMQRNEYARHLLTGRLASVRAAIGGITEDHKDKDLNPLLEQIALLEARVAEVFQ